MSARLRPVLAPLVLALLLAACGDDAPELVAKARTAIAAKDNKAAQIHLKNALQQEPQRAEARFLLGQLLLEGGDPQGGLVELDKAGEAGHPPAQLVPLQARALLALRQSRKLVERFGKTELPDPKAQTELLTLLAQAQLRLGQEDAGRALLEQALKLQPEAVEPQLELARLQAAGGKLDAALAAVEALIARQPQQAAAWRFKGELLAVGQRDPEGARAAFEKAVELDPRNADAQFGLIGQLLALRQQDAAAAQLAKARTQLAKAPGLNYYGALIDLEKGKLDSAATQTEQLLKTNPEDGRVLLLAGQVELLRERYLQAESHLVKAVGTQANPLRARLLLAQTYLRLADPARAVQSLQPLLDEPGNDARLARVHALAGEAYLQLGETRRAEAQFQRAAALNPKDARSRTLLALGKVQQGGDARGLAELRELADTQESAVADLALVSTLTRKGDFAGAMTAIDQIAKKLPNQGMPATLRAQVHLAQGNEPEARKALEGALRDNPKYLPAALQLARLDLLAQQPARAVEQVAAVAKADADSLVAQLALVNVRQQAGEPLPPLVERLRELVRQHPQQARARAALVRLQLRSGEFAAAAQSAQEGVSTLPNEAELVELLAEAQLRQREPVLAAKSLDRLIELRPAAPEPLLRKAELEAGEGKFREALASTRKALALRAQHPQALRLQVLLEAQLGNLPAARRYAKELQRLQGLEAFGAAVEGDLEFGQRDFVVAEAAYRRALSRQAALPDLPAKLHRTLLAAGKTDAASALARDWFKDHPRDIGFLNYLGDVALNAGLWAPARQQYERSLALQPRQALVLNNLAWLALQQGDLPRGDAWAREALRLAPADAPLHDTLAALLSAAGKHEEAQASQRRALALDPNPVFRVGLAKRLLAAGRKDAARDELQTVQRLGAAYKGQREVEELLAKSGA